MEIYDVIIIGGGLSGLSAGVELSKIGKKILLLEQKPHCGGRAYSFIDKKSNDYVDNGQHLMMGCYNETRQLLKTIGSDNLAFLQPSLSIKFLDSNKLSIFSCLQLPSPIHLISGLMSFDALPLKDRIKMLIIAKELFLKNVQEENLEQITTYEWLNIIRQSELSKKYFWNVLTIGALNNYPQNVSALMLYRVLKNVFSGKRENSSLLIPKVSLNELFVEPAIRYIKINGGDVRTSACVEKINIQQNKIHSVVTTTGEQLSAKAFISAVPWFSIEKIIESSKLNEKIRINTSKFCSSPIISINIWFEKESVDYDFAALIGTKIQWLFNKNKIANKANAEHQYISLVISGAQDLIDLSSEELLEIAVEDLVSVIPKIKESKIIHSLVLKEKRATFTPAPNLEAYRPNAKTGIENFFIAGDWTKTGLPATIESAIMSGRKAVCELGKTKWI